MPQELQQLLAEREHLYQELSQVGDLRRGSIAENYRRCGKGNCACRQPKHPGHGPQYLLMTKVGGRSQARNLRPGAELEKIQQEVRNHQRFRELVQKVVEVNERICELRPVQQQEPDDSREELKKKLRRRSSRRSARK